MLEGKRKLGYSSGHFFARKLSVIVFVIFWFWGQDGHFTASAKGGLCMRHGRLCAGGKNLQNGSPLDLMIAGFSCKSNSMQLLGQLERYHGH